MKYILIKDVKGLGKAGDLVQAKQGYARNFLLPNNLAIEGTKENLKKWEEEQKNLRQTELENRKDAEALKEKLEGLKINIKAKTGDGDRLFGSITTIDIANKLEEKGLAVERKKIELDEPIRALGNYTVPVRVYPEIIANLTIQVEKE